MAGEHVEQVSWERKQIVKLISLASSPGSIKHYVQNFLRNCFKRSYSRIAFCLDNIDRKCPTINQALEYVILYIIILSELSANETCQRKESDEENENSDDDDEYGIPAAELLRASSEEEDQMVEEEGKRVRKLFAGASARRALRKMNKAMKKCQDGYFCEMKGRGDGKGECQRKKTTGNYNNNNVAKAH